MEARHDEAKGRIDYRSLMSHRIRKILLICNNYDRYTLEEDGHIQSQITHEYAELNLSNPPSIRVPSRRARRSTCSTANTTST